MKVPGIRYVQGLNDYEDQDGMHYGFAIHNTSNDASDEGEAAYATRRTDGVSSHFYCDDDSVTQSLDTNDKAGHAGSKNGNENSIAIEITGANGMSRAWWLNNVAWDKLAAVLAYVIKNDPDYRGFQVRRASVSEMKSNPRVKAFYGHNDMRLAWGGTTHTDPGPNFPWDKLISSVQRALGGNVSMESEVNNLYVAKFYGGPSCGEKVDDEYRTMKKDAEGNDVFANTHGNSDVEQWRQIKGDLKKVLSALAAMPTGPAGPQGPAGEPGKDATWPANITITGTAQVSE